jgi:hypothetical protein
MDAGMRPRRSQASQMKRCTGKSIGCGEISSSQPRGIRPSVKSLARGTLDEGLTSLTVSLSARSSPQDTRFSMGSMLSADASFVFLDSHSQEEDSHDAYLGRRRRRTVKQEPPIPRCQDFDDHVTACTSPETTTTSASPPRSPGRSSSLMHASFPNSPDVPARASYSRYDSANVSNSTTAVSKEQTYWKSIVMARTMTYGTKHRQTAEAFFTLGHAYMRMHDYREAMGAFQSATKIWKALEVPTHLSVGRALDAYGLAALRYQKSGASLRQAKAALDEAFAIRFHHLGVWHVDTVETYNKIASVQLHMGKLSEACKAYEEVYFVRKAIFGVNHPSVAISAHALANVHLKLAQPEDSFRYYKIAFEIYKSMHLPSNHPTVARLLSDRKRLELSVRRR